MALRIWAVIGCLVFVTGEVSVAALGEPFPLGLSMSNQGGVMDAEGALGRQPWVPAAFLWDTISCGVAACGTAYYWGMEKNASVLQYGAGGWLRRGRFVCKLSLVQFDALNVYYEQMIYVSVGLNYRFLGLSVDVKPCRMGLWGTDDARALVTAAVTCLIRMGLVDLSLSADELVVESSGTNGSDPYHSFKAGLYTRRNRYGTQGVLVQTVPHMSKPVRFVIAQEYRIGSSFAVSAALSSNPTMISFGIAVDFSPVSGGAAVVNHPVLGWSKGFSIDYSK
ncbi:MAG: hypothetical protein ACLFVQ_10685 [Chitinispirillaceae bacterium]